MDSMIAFAMGQANRSKPLKVFDWKQAALMIAEIRPNVAVAGLEGDFEWTAGTIFENGRLVLDNYTYLTSTWATPQIVLDGEVFDCWVYLSQEPMWNEETKWPRSCLKYFKECK